MSSETTFTNDIDSNEIVTLDSDEIVVAYEGGLEGGLEGGVGAVAA